jgi:hypothetical protein
MNCNSVNADHTNASAVVCPRHRGAPAVGNPYNLELLEKEGTP